MFATKSFDKIMSTFTTAINDLTVLTKHHEEHIADKSDHINDLESEIRAHDQERLRTQCVLKKLTNLLEGDTHL